MYASDYPTVHLQESGSQKLDGKLGSPASSLEVEIFIQSWLSDS